MNGESVGESVFEEKKETKYFSYCNTPSTQNNKSSESASGESTNSSTSYSYNSEPRRDYVNETEVKSIYTKLKADVEAKETKLKKLAKEYDVMPLKFMETRSILKKQIAALKEDIDEQKRKLILLTLENPSMFKVELNDVNVYER